MPFLLKPNGFRLKIEEIFVKEGEQVKNGQIVALMSSTERAALLDAARVPKTKKRYDIGKKRISRHL